LINVINCGGEYKLFKKIFLLTLLLIVVVSAGCAGQPAKPSEKASLKFGVIPLIINLPAHVAIKEGLFEKQNLTVEIVSFRSTAEQETALLTGAIDGLFNHIFTAVLLNKDKETSKLVGACTMPGMYKIIASGSSGIIDIKGLKGKEVADGTNTSVDFALEQIITAKGLAVNDITKVNVPVMPMRLEMLNQGKVPAAILSPPLSDLAISGGGKLLADDSVKPLAGPGVIVTQAALKDKADAISRFIQGWQQAVDMINANPEKYRGLLVEIANVPAPLAQTIQVPNFPKLKNPDKGEVDAVIDWLVSKAVMSKRISYQEVVDTKFIK
jgi:NitT/TauT family transport system substrate-binding protein